MPFHGIVINVFAISTLARAIVWEKKSANLIIGASFFSNIKKAQIKSK